MSCTSFLLRHRSTSVKTPISPTIYSLAPCRFLHRYGTEHYGWRWGWRLKVDLSGRSIRKRAMISAIMRVFYWHVIPVRFACTSNAMIFAITRNHIWIFCNNQFYLLDTRYSSRCLVGYECYLLHKLKWWGTSVRICTGWISNNRIIDEKEICCFLLVCSVCCCYCCLAESCRKWHNRVINLVF